MRGMGYVEGSTCGITQEALDRVKAAFHTKYGQYLTNKQSLWLCGFIVDGKASLQEQYHIYRHQTMPSLVSEGIVWKGWVRNEVDVEKPIDHKGRIRYTTKYHHMQPIYFRCEVVTGDMITEEVVQNILDIGSLKEYDKGLGRELRELRNPKKIKPVDMNDYEE